MSWGGHNVAGMKGLGSMQRIGGESRGELEEGAEPKQENINPEHEVGGDRFAQKCG